MSDAVPAKPEPRGDRPHEVCDGVITDVLTASQAGDAVKEEQIAAGAVELFHIKLADDGRGPCSKSASTSPGRSMKIKAVALSLVA
jgi:hypothetical protein